MYFSFPFFFCRFSAGISTVQMIGERHLMPISAMRKGPDSCATDSFFFELCQLIAHRTASYKESLFNCFKRLSSFQLCLVLFYSVLFFSAQIYELTQCESTMSSNKPAVDPFHSFLAGSIAGAIDCLLYTSIWLS